jgi:hypothetical protein
MKNLTYLLSKCIQLQQSGWCGKGIKKLNRSGDGAEMKPHAYVQLIFYKGTKGVKSKGKDFSTKKILKTE